MADVSLESTVKSFIPRGSELERGGKKEVWKYIQNEGVSFQVRDPLQPECYRWRAVTQLIFTAVVL